MTPLFACEKQPVTGARGAVVTNTPLGSAAGIEMLAAGGNAVDAAVAALLTLTVVEPMMVGIAGGGVSHLRLPDGTHVVFDALAAAPIAIRPDIFTPDPAAPQFSFATLGQRNVTGPSAVAVPGNLLGWFQMQQDYGRLSFADVIEPAIRAAARGFLVSGYFHSAVRDNAAVLANCPDLSSLLLPKGQPIAEGARLVMSDYAASLRLIQSQGAAALHGGVLGQALVDSMNTGGGDQGCLTMADMTGYRVMRRQAIQSSYRGHQIFGPPPPASSGVHIAQMLNLLEPYDLAAMGYASTQTKHLLAEVIRIAFEDRRAASGDPDFVDVPVQRYISKAYAAECQQRRRHSGGALQLPQAQYESYNTTHVTTADKDGLVVSATHTINGLFGARYAVPGTGIIPNNYMLNFDPTPGRAMSIEPGKRVPTSMAPMIVENEGKPVFALGLPGGIRIFPAATQAIVNLIDHGMSLQEAVEAPRLWTEGAQLELEEGYAPLADAMRALGHRVEMVRSVGGGMNAVAFGENGMMTGAACWRADGTPMAIGGGNARPGTRFRI